MSILKYKYKAHKFINYAFYIVVFIFGFLLGFTTEKIDFNKLISQVLMIDSVSAYDIPETNSINEEYIYNIFLENENFNIEEFPYIRCSKNNSSTEMHCFAYKKEYLDSISSITKYTTSNSSNYRFVVTTSLTQADNYYIWFKIGNINSSNISYSTPSFDFISNVNDYQATTNTTYYGTWTNFNFPTNLEHSDVLNTYNVLDFEGSNLQFNENLFKDNSNFKEVCVDKGKKYSITTTNIDIASNSIFVSDFIWFPGKVTGVKYSEYDSLEDDNILVFNDDVSTENYYFKDKEKIDLYFNDEIISNYFIHSGYTDKYSLYGYTAYKFIHSYYVDDDNNSQNMFTIFDFTDMNFSPFGSAGGSSGSFGDTPLTYCFYIKNEFNVTELQTNEWDDYVGTVPTPGGDLDVITSHNRNNSSDKVDSFFSTINNVISELRPTINFIKQHIEQLYLSMPLIVRSFIISFLVLIVIRILIGMVVK